MTSTPLPAEPFEPKPTGGATPQPAPPGNRWVDKYPWTTYVLPLVVFMLLGSLEPNDPEKPLELLGFSIPYAAYPLIYILKIAITMVAMAAVWPGYRQFAWRVSPWALLVGGAGVVAWVGLSKLGLEARLWPLLGLGEFGRRTAFDPTQHWPDQPLLAYEFLAIRFWGLAVIVPIIEEFFLRGFVMRFVVAERWWQVPFGTLTPMAAAVGTVLPMAMHPAELLAAAIWFSLVTWLMWRTKNIWDCVVAHGVTNLLLGLWVLYSGDWFFL